MSHCDDQQYPKPLLQATQYGNVPSDAASGSRAASGFGLDLLMLWHDAPQLRAEARPVLGLSAILECRQPADLSLKQLMYRTNLALDWA